MLKKNIFFTLVLLLQATAHAAITSFPLAEGVEQGEIINAIYSIGGNDKLALLLVINNDYIKSKEKDGLLWMLENIHNRLAQFTYCQHELAHPELACTCAEHKKDDLHYSYVTSFEHLANLCGKTGAPTLFIFKNGKVLHKITRDVLLSSKMLTHEKERIIIETIVTTYKKALAVTDFNAH